MNGKDANLGCGSAFFRGPLDEDWESIREIADQTAVYSYRTAMGRISFQRVKLEFFEEQEEQVYEGVKLPRRKIRTGKQILYRHMCDERSRCNWKDHWTGKVGLHWEKPARADGLIYNLPEVQMMMLREAPVYICEGESDADAVNQWLVKNGVEGVATTHHQGAEVGANASQVALLAGYTNLRVVMDGDSAGAYNAWKWCELLKWNGVYVYRPKYPIHAGYLSGRYAGDIREVLEGRYYEKTKSRVEVSSLTGEALEIVQPLWLREAAMNHIKERRKNWEKVGGKRQDYMPGQRLGEAVSK